MLVATIYGVTMLTYFYHCKFDNNNNNIIIIIIIITTTATATLSEISEFSILGIGQNRKLRNFGNFLFFF